MDVMGFVNSVLLVVVAAFICLITFGVMNLKEVPEYVTIDMLGLGSLKIKYLILANALILLVLLFIVYKYTAIFTWISSGLMIFAAASLAISFYKGKKRSG